MSILKRLKSKRHNDKKEHTTKSKSKSRKQPSKKKKRKNKTNKSNNIKPQKRKKSNAIHRKSKKPKPKRTQSVPPKYSNQNKKKKKKKKSAQNIKSKHNTKPIKKTKNRNNKHIKSSTELPHDRSKRKAKSAKNKPKRRATDSDTKRRKKSQKTNTKSKQSKTNKRKSDCGYKDKKANKSIKHKQKNRANTDNVIKCDAKHKQNNKKKRKIKRARNKRKSMHFEQDIATAKRRLGKRLSQKVNTSDITQLIPSNHRQPVRFLSLYEIVELVTSPKARGTHHQNVLLNTYTLFTSKEELLEVILKRFTDISDDKAQQIKVISLLKKWLKTDTTISKLLVIHTQDNAMLQKLFVSMLSPRIDEDEQLSDAPDSKIPQAQSAKELDLNMLDPTEVARQICLNEYQIFKSIKPEEFIKHSSSKHTKLKWKVTNDEHILDSKELLKQARELQTEHEEKEWIHKFSDQFNRLSVWTQSEILERMDLNQRCKIVSQILDICRQLEKYNNISSLYAIHGGLSSAPIYRLSKTWDNIPKKGKETMAHLDELFKLGNGQKNLRDRISIISQPAIPHLGIFLGDIAFIHDGNNTFSKDDEKKINWGKMELLQDRIAWISMFQQYPFVFKPVAVITEYLESKMKMISQEFLYRLSRAVEPPANKTK